MKKNSFLYIILIILAFVFVPTAQAADGAALGDSFIGKLHVGKGTATDAGWDCVGHTCKQIYYYYPFSVEYNSTKYTAYCIYPGGHTANNSPVTCTRLDPKQHEMIYYLIENHYEEISAMDPIVQDFIYRLFGVYDKHAATPGLVSKINEICETKPTQCKQARWEAAFITTWQARAFNTPFIDPGFYGFVLHNRTAHAGGGATYFEDGYINTAIALFKEAYDAVSAGYHYSGDMTPAEGGSGKKFEISMVPDSMAAEDKSVLYNVKTVGGVSYSGIKVSAVTGSVSIVSWSGTSGVIKVTPETNGNSCKASINIAPDTCEDFKGEPSTPTPPSTPTKKCACKLGEYVEKKPTEYPCKPGTKNIYVESKTEKGGGYYTCTVANRDVPNPPEKKINWTCEYDKKKCEAWSSHLPDLYKPASNNDANFNDTLTLDYETEHDLSFDSGLAYSSDDVFNTDNNAIKKLDATSESSEESVKVYLCNISGNVTDQSYLTFLKKAPCSDSFELDIPCTGDCYTGNCAPADHFKDYKDVDIHNCCDENATSKGRQAALNELFCDYSKGGLSIPNYALRCNADEYLDNRPINDYCVQYCSSSFTYDLPAPTHSKQDRYFYWSKRNGVSGPVLNQYRRCRTLIKYDEWYAAYARNVDNLISNYNGSQKNYAFYNMWVDMIAAGKKETYGSTNEITCTTTWSWTYNDTCYTSCTEGTTDCVCTGTGTAKTCSKAYTCSKPASTSNTQKGTPDTKEIHYYNAADFYNDSKYQYGILERYDVVGGSDSYSKIKLKSKANPDDKTKYYNKSEFESYINSNWKTKKSAVETASKSTTGLTIGAGATSSTSCTSEPTLTTIDPEAKKKEYKDAADGFIKKYDGATGAIATLKDNLNTCGGEKTADEARVGNDNAGSDSTKSLFGRTKFGTEPEMEFSYAAKYIGIDGTENDQEIPIKFEKVGGEEAGKCIQVVDTSVKYGLEGEEELYDALYMEGTVFFGSNRDSETYKGDLTAKLYDMKPIGDAGKLDKVSDKETGIEWYGGHKNDVYYADKKFTTDARAHMTCKWTDVPEDEVYTIIPNGVILEEEETGRLCEDTTYNCLNYMDGHGNEYTNDGIYHTYKGHVAGKFETYFTLYNICVVEGETKGLFDDVIHEEGLPCSEQEGLKNYNNRDVNATCYIEIKPESAQYFDCTGAEVLSKEEAASTICCKDGICDQAPKLLYDYKVVDTEDMFSEEYVASIGGGFAHNWVTDPTGKATLQKMTEDGKNDVTYAPENLTYSFTLTPTDLRQIREYNKTRVEKGGYNDFNLYCSQSADKKTLEKCKSRFIEAISGGTSLTSGTVTLELKTNKMDLSTSRSRIWGGA